MKKMIVCDFGEWTKRLITLSRFESIDYFVDDKLRFEQVEKVQGKKIQSCGIEKKIFPVERLLEEKPDNVIIIIGDSKLFIHYKRKLEELGFKENVHFFNGWNLTSEFYRNLFENRTWETIEEDHKDVFLEEGYEDRAKAIAGLIPKEVNSIMDLGCGKEVLKKYINGIRYIGVDYKKRSEDTIICNLEKDSLPEINVDMYCLIGVIYYLKNVKSLVKQMKNAKYVLLTYRGMEHFRRLDNRFDGVYSGGLENSLYTADLINIFLDTNFILEKWVRGFPMGERVSNEDIFIFRNKSV